MYPALKDRDIVKLVDRDMEKIRCGDIAALSREDGVMVLHRVIVPGKRMGMLMTWGDNANLPDAPCNFKNIIGKVVAVVSDGTERPVPGSPLFVYKRRILLLLRKIPEPIKWPFKQTHIGRLCKSRLWSLLAGL